MKANLAAIGIAALGMADAWMVYGVVQHLVWRLVP